LKDVDGLSDINAGKLANGNLDTVFVPCTPKGCHELIESTGLSLTGKNVVIIGRSRLIGTPLANYLKWHDATVTICHSKTLELSDICQRADVLIAAVGKIKLVKQDWIKNGATVIDCGINYSNGMIWMGHQSFTQLVDLICLFVC
jgi:methylenetetrahydrofolate dehydrogenase (NADP+)/methenyltetrahydrofolate cyclohydrolase/formyltetrahydrofolate synthetase